MCSALGPGEGPARVDRSVGWPGSGFQGRVEKRRVKSTSGGDGCPELGVSWEFLTGCNWKLKGGQLRMGRPSLLVVPQV